MGKYWEVLTRESMKGDKESTFQHLGYIMYCTNSINLKGGTHIVIAGHIP